MWLRIVFWCSVITCVISDCTIYLNDKCICDETRCLKKCCGESHWLENGLCVKKFDPNSTLLEPSEEYNISKVIKWCENPTQLSDEDLGSSEGFCVEENYEPLTQLLTVVKCPLSSKILHSTKAPVRKCCADNEILVNSTCERRDNLDLKPLFNNINFRSNQRLVNSMLKCSKNRHRIRVNMGTFELMEDGSLLWEEEVLVNVDSYCVDLFTKDDVTYRTLALLCLEADEEISTEVHATGASESYCKESETTLNFSVPIFNVTRRLYNLSNFSVGMLTCNENSYVRYFKLNNSDPTERYYVQANGSLYYHRSRKFYAPDRFCVDEEDGLSVYLCYSHVPQRPALPVQAGMIISMPFLLLTFLVYLIIPEKNLHRKALMCYVICLLLAYVFLVTSNLSKVSFPDVPCHLIGYFIMFFFLGSFLWMNVMCIDMWLTFSGARGYSGTRSTEQKRFLFYCLYALGAPVIFILFVFLLNTYGDEESIFHPKLGRNKCFLEDGYPQLLYLYLPMAILIGMNIILFILTAIKIQKVKTETAMLKHNDSRKHNYEGDKQQFNLYLKLLFAMGVNWTTEVISWAALWKMQSVPSWIWYLTDLINALYGIFIFFIFVFKKKIWQSLKKRYYVFIGKPHLAQTMVTSTNTRTSHMSSSEVGEYRMSDMRNGRAEERALRS